MTAAAAFAAWLGGASMVLSDGRRGLALGLAVMGAAFAGLAWAGGEVYGAIALLAGAFVGAALLLRGDGGGWGLMEPGSTPRIVLTVVAGLVSLWVAVSVAAGDDAPLRFAVLATLAMMSARVVQGSDRAVSLGAAAAIALALGTAAGLAPSPPGPAPYAIAGLIAVGAAALAISKSRIEHPHAEAARKG